MDPPSLRYEDDATESPVINAPMVEVADRASGTQYVYRPWTLTDIKKVCAELPKVEEVGGREYSHLLEHLICQYRPSIAEIRHLLMAHVGLKWDRVEEIFPGITIDTIGTPIIKPIEHRWMG